MNAVLRSTAKSLGAAFAGLLLWIGLASATPQSPEPDLTDAARAALLELQPLRGPALDRADLDDRIVLVSFVASWCGPCWQELSSFNHVARRMGDAPVTLVAVNAFEDWLGGGHPAKRALFLDRASGAYPLLEAVEGTEVPFAVSTLPAFVAYDRSGKRIDPAVYRRGPRTRYATVDEIESLIERILAAAD